MKPHYYVTHPELSIGNKYKTLAEATAEAEQLAEKHPGTAFEILQCLGVSSVPKASTFWMDGVEPEQKAGLAGLDAEIKKHRTNMPSRWLLTTKPNLGVETHPNIAIGRVITKAAAMP